MSEQARPPETPPEAQPETPGRPARHPVRVVVLVLVAVLAAVVVVRLVGGGSGGDADREAGAGGGAGAVPTPPASAPARGSYVASAVAADGTVTVQQWIRSTAPIRSLDVATVDPQSQGTAAQAVDVRVQGLDGSTLAARASVGDDPVRLRMSQAVPNLYLTYRITGGVADASETVQGRMLVNVLGMDVDYTGSAGGAVQRTVSGPGTVTNVACLRVDDADSPPKPCGTPTADGGWQVSLRGIDRTDRLLAQVESTGTASASASAS